MKRPAWLRKGARVAFACKVVRFYDHGKRVHVVTPTGLHLGLWMCNLGKTWDRSQRAKAGRGKARK